MTLSEILKGRETNEITRYCNWWLMEESDDVGIIPYGFSPQERILISFTPDGPFAPEFKKL